MDDRDKIIIEACLETLIEYGLASYNREAVCRATTEEVMLIVDTPGCHSCEHWQLEEHWDCEHEKNWFVPKCVKGVGGTPITGCRKFNWRRGKQKVIKE